jgi:hypothetical protein
MFQTELHAIAIITEIRGRDNFVKLNFLLTPTRPLDFTIFNRRSYDISSLVETIITNSEQSLAETLRNSRNKMSAIRLQDMVDSKILAVVIGVGFHRKSE